MNALTKRTLSLFAAAAFVAFLCTAAHAYILPDYLPGDDMRSLSAEQALALYEARMDEFGTSINVARLALHQTDPRTKLSQKERKSAREFGSIDAAIGFWTRVLDLKGSMVHLCNENRRDEARPEADEIARSVMETLYRVSREWRIGGSALFRNLLINLGARDKGFCWHYVSEMWKALPKKDWKSFDIRWGTAWKEDFRENNALVITAKGSPFESGIAIDPWRTAGRPFWTPVRGDRFPWKEAFDYEVE